jgi:hypothetical protein
VQELEFSSVRSGGRLVLDTDGRGRNGNRPLELTIVVEDGSSGA